MRYIVASNNKGKIKEIKAILDYDNVFSLEEIGFYDDIKEYGNTFEINALIKAQELSFLYPNDIIISDDSGLCIDSLNGEPGVYSARYAKDDLLYKEDKFLACMNKVMKKLEGVDDKKAHFVSVICLIIPGNEPVFFRGELHGEISNKIRHGNGFGYDPIFLYNNQYISMLSDEEKNSISHRKKAIKKMQKFLEDRR